MSLSPWKKFQGSIRQAERPADRNSLDGPYDPAQGTPTLRTMLCKISKVNEKYLSDEKQFWLSNEREKEW